MKNNLMFEMLRGLIKVVTILIATAHVLGFLVNVGDYTNDHSLCDSINYKPINIIVAIPIYNYYLNKKVACFITTPFE